MNGTTTRARTGRATADQRRSARAGASYSDGANALQIGYEDVEETGYRGRERERALLAPPAVPRRRVRPAPAEHTVMPPLPIALPRAPFLVLMVTLVVVGVVGVLVLNTRINENAFRLDALRSQQAALNLQEEQLSQNLTELEAPGNLRAAANLLGLVPAGTPAFISLPDGRVVGAPQPATGQPSNASTAGR